MRDIPDCWSSATWRRRRGGPASCVDIKVSFSLWKHDLHLLITHLEMVHCVSDNRSPVNSTQWTFKTVECAFNAPVYERSWGLSGASLEFGSTSREQAESESKNRQSSVISKNQSNNKNDNTFTNSKKRQEVSIALQSVCVCLCLCMHVCVLKKVTSVLSNELQLRLISNPKTRMW